MSVNYVEEANAIFSLFRYFKFKEFVLWHSDSSLGSYLGSNFLNRHESSHGDDSGEDEDTESNTEFQIVDVPVPADDDGTETQRSLNRILSLRVRVILVHAEEKLAKLMMSIARRNNMLNGDYLFFGSTLWTFGSDEAHVVRFNEEERVYLQGVVGLSYPRLNATSSSRFLKRLIAINPELYPPYRNTQYGEPMIVSCGLVNHILNF
jgi:hypothetical protein